MNAPVTLRPWLQPALLAGLVLNAAFVVVAFWLFHSDREAFTRFTKEDGFAEWFQFLAFASLALMFAFLACERFVQPPRPVLQAAGLAALAAAFTFAALEEVSYFQRVIGVETPDFFLKHNKQSEMNLHNLVVGEVSVSKHIIVKLVAIFALTHNLVLPLLARKYPQVRRWVEGLGFYIPPLSVALFYLGLVALSQTMLDHSRKGEVLELLGGVYYLSTAYAAYFAGVICANPVFRDAHSRNRASALFVAFLLLLILVAWILGSVSLGPAKP